MRRLAMLLSLVLAAALLVGASAEAKPKPKKPKKHGYVVSELLVPASNNQAREVAFDLNGDGTVDNQLGQVFATFAGQGIDVQGATSQAITSGSFVTLFSVRTPSLKDAKKKVTVKLLKGLAKASPDLDGGGTFAVDKAYPATKLKAKIVKKVVTSKVGTIKVLMPTFLPGLAPVSYDLVKGRITATCAKKRCSAGRFGGAIPSTQIDAKLIPQMGNAIRTVIATDCPSGEASCTPGSTGSTMLQLFDLDNDDLVTDQEIRDSPLIQSLLAPDVDVNGDGEADALSVAFGFTAVYANVLGD